MIKAQMPLPAGTAPSTSESASLLGRIGLVCSTILASIGLFSMGLVLPTMQQAFAGQAAADWVPWVGSAVSPAFAIGSFTAGPVIARLGYRRVHMASTLAFALVGIAPAFTSSLPLIVAARLLLGLATAGVMTAALDGIARLPAASRSTYFGMLVVVGGIGATAMYPLVAFLIGRGWHAAFLIHLVGLLLLPCSFGMARTRRVIQESRHDFAEHEVMARVPVWLLALAAGWGLLAFIAQMFSPFRMQAIGIVDPARAQVPLMCMGVGAMAASAVYGRVHRRLGTTNVFALAGGLLAVGLAFVTVARNELAFAAALALTGLGNGLTGPNLFSAATETGGAQPGRTLGIVNGAIYLSPLPFPWLMHAALSYWGSQVPFLLFAIFSAISCILFAVRARVRRGDDEAGGGPGGVARS